MEGRGVLEVGLKLVTKPFILKTPFLPKTLSLTN